MEPHSRPKRVSKLRRGRSNHYDRPHDIYVLADPRSGQIRYVGRTVRGTAFRLRQHVKEAKHRRPIHRWLHRLESQGLSPVCLCVAKDVDYSYELHLSEALVARGVRLLNMRPTCARAGRLLVDMERAPKSTIISDVVHLGLEIASEGRISVHSVEDVLGPVAARALRRVADILDPPPKSGGVPSQDDRETAMFLASRLFDVVLQGSPLRSRMNQSPTKRETTAFADQAKAAIRQARLAVKHRRKEPLSATA